MSDLRTSRARAFSLRRNLKLLWVPTAGHLRPLDGLRALSILWVTLFHVGWYSIAVLPAKSYVRLLVSGWMLPFWRGDFGVDVFFVLSGFLIAGMLIDERERTGQLALGLFYGRRLLRLWPALLVALLVDLGTVERHPETAWGNVFYVSNFIPIGLAAMGWTWSLAIEEQFYLACPWLVSALARGSARARGSVLGALVVALAGVGCAVVTIGHFGPSDVEVVITRDLFRWSTAFDALYSKPWMRTGPLLAGVAAAYVHRAPGAIAALSRWTPAATAGLLIATISVGAAATHWPLYVGLPRAAEVAYVACFRTVFGTCVAVVLLLALTTGAVGRGLGRVLSARLLHPIAQLAYSAYLLNPIVAQLVQGRLWRLVPDGGPWTFVLLAAIEVPATFLAATVLHLAVERPVMELRPRAPA